MGKPRRGPQLLVAGGVVAGVLLVAAILGFASDSSSPQGDAEPVIVCVDSTVSTEGVRAGYLPNLEAIARRAAIRQARFYAAACGANATGTVGWPVHRKFESSYEAGSEKAKEQARSQAREVTKGNEKEKGLEDLVETSSTRSGTPLGEMLAVTARQCGQAGGGCIVYLFTDGEWVDGELKASDGVTREERTRYLDTYVPILTEFAGSEVNFIGVGLGTDMREVRLNEAREIATELVEGAGGEVSDWAARL